MQLLVELFKTLMLSYQAYFKKEQRNENSKVVLNIEDFPQLGINITLC